MALTAKNMPYKQGFGPFAPEVYRVPMAYPFRWPTGPERLRREAAAAGDRRDRQEDRRRRTSPASSIEPIQGEGGFIVPARATCRAGRVLPAQRHPVRRRRDPDRLRGAPATGSPASTRASCPTSSRPPRASPAACRWPRSPAGPRSWTRSHVGGLGGTYGGNPVACAAALGAIRHDRGAGPVSARARRLGAIDAAPAARAGGPRPGRSATCGAAARWSPSSSCSPGTTTPDPAATAAVARGLPPAGRGGAHRRHLRQRAALPAAAGHPGPPARRSARS